MQADSRKAHGPGLYFLYIKPLYVGHMGTKSNQPTFFNLTNHNTNARNKTKNDPNMLNDDLSIVKACYKLLDVV